MTAIQLTTAVVEQRVRGIEGAFSLHVTWCDVRYEAAGPRSRPSETG